MKFLLTLLLIVVLVFGGMVLLAHHDTTARADVEFRKQAPVTASFSRLRGDKEHLLSVYWRLHFAEKSSNKKQTVAYWSLRPFRHVTMVTK